MRKLATAAAVSLALSSGGAFGLGLGDIEMQSALNQPMDAEIPLTSVRPGELDGMIVQLASAEAFARAGIERSAVLTDLSFTVDQSSGTPVIKIVSARPVVEPFLNFLLEVDWPQGRMVREYTVLLDPPVFMTPSASERNTAADQPAILQSGEAALVAPTPIERNVDLLEEGIEIDLGELEDATPEEVLSLDEATALNPIDSEGEIVSLDGLSDEVLLSGGAGIASDAVSDSAATIGNDLADGDVVSLTDLGAPNIEAEAQREAEALEVFSLDDIQVETVGSTEEITDTVVVGEDGLLVDNNDIAASVTELASDNESVDDGSTIVSLDGIEETVAPAADIQSSGDATVTVGDGDTLFEIARDTAPSGVSVQQMMMAMLAANESAFINRNINLVRSGAILRIPDGDDASSLTQTQAIAAISDQNRLWQDYRDNLRATAGTQVAQTIAPDSDTQQADAQSSDDVPSDNTEQSLDTAALETDLSIDGLSDEARAILDNARNEILNGEELKIVADNSPSSTTASATADETTDSEAARIGEVNRQIQLTREELSATRLASTELADKASELQNTTDSLDAMVSLRQNEVARLEQQLIDAKQAAEEQAQREAEQAAKELAEAEQAAKELAEAEKAAADAAREAEQALDDAAREAEQAATDAATEAGETAEEVASEAEGAEDAATDLADEVATEAETAVDAVAESGTNALTEAGETLGEVELLASDENEGAATDTSAEAVDTDAAEAADTEALAVTAPVTEVKSWYQEFLDDPKRMAIAGVGGLGLLGVLGTLLFRRKRRAPEESLEEMIAKAEVNDGAPAAPDTQAVVAASNLDDTSAFSATSAATIALDEKSDDAVDEMDNAFAESVVETDTSSHAFGASDDANTLPAAGSEVGADALDKDDTISEVDVYLAYGLHGQAEELLTKAIERKPESAEYAGKLLQTYHAQGNADAFHANASDFYQRFGGDDNPEWTAIAKMGAELNPEDPLYKAPPSLISQVSSGSADLSTMGDDDFTASEGADDIGSVSRDFGSVGPATDLKENDSELMMDASLDPAFAFDEGDLEATGDFSAIANELASDDDDGSIDFPGLDDVGSAANEALEDEVASGDGTVLDDALSIDELDGLSESVDDLTLDLDQLSGELELDSAELLSSDLSDLEIPDLSADNELLLDSSGALGDNDGDEMDTMMDLAKAYIDMGDKDSASSALDEIVKSGNPEQVTEAETLLRKIS